MVYLSRVKSWHLQKRRSSTSLEVVFLVVDVVGAAVVVAAVVAVFIGVVVVVVTVIAVVGVILLSVCLLFVSGQQGVGDVCLF